MNSQVEINRTKAIKFWVTEEEKKIINTGASLHGKGKGDFFRNCILIKSHELIKQNFTN